MPLYDFINDSTSEVKTLFFHMNDEKRYVGEDGTEWRRVFTVPGAAIDSASKIDPYSKKDFVSKTGSKRGTVGDMMDLSAELSHERASKDGIDHTKEKFLESYKKDTGKEYKSLDKKKTVTHNGISVDFSP